MDDGCNPPVGLKRHAKFAGIWMTRLLMFTMLLVGTRVGEAANPGPSAATVEVDAVFGHVFDDPEGDPWQQDDDFIGEVEWQQPDDDI